MKGDLRCRIILALVLSWGVVAPSYHRIDHWRAEAKHSVERHAGHVHDEGHAVDARPPELPDDLVCLACATHTTADLDSEAEPILSQKDTPQPNEPDRPVASPASAAVSIRGPPSV